MMVSYQLKRYLTSKEVVGFILKGQWPEKVQWFLVNVKAEGMVPRELQLNQYFVQTSMLIIKMILSQVPNKWLFNQFLSKHYFFLHFTKMCRE